MRGEGRDVTLLALVAVEHRPPDDLQLRGQHTLYAVRRREHAVPIYQGAAAELLPVVGARPRLIQQRRHEWVLAAGHGIPARDLRLDLSVASHGLFGRDARHRGRKRQKHRQ
jgi:hypothetical protein